jgi:hypothetical protein
MAVDGMVAMSTACIEVVEAATVFVLSSLWRRWVGWRRVIVASSKWQVATIGGTLNSTHFLAGRGVEH